MNILRLSCFVPALTFFKKTKVLSNFSLSRDMGAFPIFCKNAISGERERNSNTSFLFEGKMPQAGCLCYNVQLVNQKSGMRLLFKLCPPLAGVQGVDWISPSIQLPLYYENKFDPLSHTPQTGQMDNFILFRDMHSRRT
ncbi:hypothetical protein KsCSTR_32310 [Candidatus Kuenenia stuttgartiensis]|nr:hypothetical protein KsCSTR_32310 [Candidatus Kuenenia stuttgartiensis]SOH02891.1 hypothetical protein KSMBR1_0375 [Candidatus Kuenenia stuttgartiensis]